MTAATTTPSTTAYDSGRLSFASLIGLHVLPGLPLVGITLAAAPLLLAWHLPVVWGLLGGILLVQMPLLEMMGRRLGGPRTLSPASRPVLLTIAVTFACTALPGLTVWCEPLLRATVFGWVPSWWSLTPAGSPGWVQGVTIVLWVGAAVIVGPIAEERYFRGVLLARIPGGPLPSAALGAVLFAAYHLWQPWAWGTVLLFALPLTIARRRLRLGLVGCCVAHCTVNAAAFAVLLAGLSTR